MAARLPVGFQQCRSSAQVAFLSSAVFRLAHAEPPGASTDQPLRDRRGSSQCRHLRPPATEADQATIEHDTLANDKTTSIFFVLEGAGTVVTGASSSSQCRYFQRSGSEIARGGSRGSGIQDGQSCRIAAGDVVIIPPGFPTGLARSRSLSLIRSRVDSGKILPPNFPLRRRAAIRPCMRSISAFARDSETAFRCGWTGIVKTKEERPLTEDGYDIVPGG
jgi:hypothetical protein